MMEQARLWSGQRAEPVLQGTGVVPRIMLAGFLALALLLIPGATHLGPTYALADDDDGGDDGGDDDGGDDDGGVGGQRGQPATSGRNKTYKQQNERKQAAKPAARKQVEKKRLKKKQARARPVIVALDLPDASIVTLRRQGFTVLSDDRLVSTGIRIQRLRAPANVSTNRAKAAVIRLGAVSADINSFYTPQGPEECSAEAGCEARNIVGWPEADALSCGVQPRIGLIETHLEMKHPALAGQMIEIIDLKPKGKPRSSTGHGTGVASLLAGAKGSSAEGLLPGAELIVATPFYRVGNADRAEAADLVRAIDALVAREPDVLNLSLAGPANDVLEKVLDVVRAKGIPVVAAAGNGGAKSAPLYPAAYDSTLAVTAVTVNLKVFRRATRGIHVDVAAPGVEVVVANGTSGTLRRSGTSFAAPFVAAAIAVMREARPLEPVDSFLERVTSSAVDLGAPGKDPIYGWGLLDASGICGTAVRSRSPMAGRPGL